MRHVHQWTILAGVVALLAGGGCGGPGSSSPGVAGTTAGPPAAAAGPTTTITLRGVAHNAKGGAVVVTDRGPIYVGGLDAWPPALAGRVIEITGVVRRLKHLPDPVGPGGTVAAGARGEQSVIVEATWRAVE